MITTIINKAKQVSTLVAAACCVAVIAGSVPAFASEGSGMSTVWDVYTGPGVIRIHLTNDPNEYFSYTSAPAGCPTWTQTADQLKLYSTMAQSALLAGKQLRITYNLCAASGEKHIDHMEIFQ